MSSLSDDTKAVLSGFSKRYLLGLTCVISKTDENEIRKSFAKASKNKLVSNLMTSFNGVVTSFVKNYNDLKSCSLTSLKELLAEERNLDLQAIDDIMNRRDWLLFVYRHSLEGKVESYVVQSLISPSSTLKEYNVKGTPKEFTAESAGKEILEGIRKFNSKSLRKFFWKSPPTFDEIGEHKLFNISLLVEGKEQRIKCFRFRREKNVPESEAFDVEKFKFNSVGKRDIALKIYEDRRILITNLNMDRDSEILSVILKPLLAEGYSIDPIKYSSHEQLVKSSISKSMESKEYTKHLIESFKELQTQRIKEIRNDSSLPEARRGAFIEVIEKVSFSGIGTDDVPEYSVEHFDFTFRDFDTAKRLAGAMEMAGVLISVSKNYSLMFSYKSARITLENGRLRYDRTVTPHEDSALKMLFGGEANGSE